MCEGSKAPGPDEVNFKFIKAYWEVIKANFLECIKYFQTTGNMANGCNPSFIAIIPKTSDPLGFSDYRPISLIGCVYKVISKILANRLSKVIGSVIGPNQSTFIVGKKLSMGVLLLMRSFEWPILKNVGFCFLRLISRKPLIVLIGNSFKI